MALTPADLERHFYPILNPSLHEGGFGANLRMRNLYQQWMGLKESLAAWMFDTRRQTAWQFDQQMQTILPWLRKTLSVNVD